MSLPQTWCWFRRDLTLWRAMRRHWGDTNSRPSVSVQGVVIFSLRHIFPRIHHLPSPPTLEPSVQHDKTISHYYARLSQSVSLSPSENLSESLWTRITCFWTFTIINLYSNTLILHINSILIISKYEQI